MKYSVIPKVGSELSAEEIAACAEVIREGGALEDPDTAVQELPKAVTIAILRAGANIVGVGAIKQPRADYGRRIAGAKKSAFAFDPQMNELGYVAILPAHRGRKSGLIMDSLLDGFTGPLWATTSESLMKHSLRNRGFAPQGNEWLNKKGKRLSLWLKTSK